MFIFEFQQLCHIRFLLWLHELYLNYYNMSGIKFTIFRLLLEKIWVSINEHTILKQYILFSIRRRISIYEMLYFLLAFICYRYTLRNKNLRRPVLIIKPDSLIQTFFFIHDNFTVNLLILKIIFGIICQRLKHLMYLFTILIKLWPYQKEYRLHIVLFQGVMTVLYDSFISLIEYYWFRDQFWLWLLVRIYILHQI